MKNVSNPFFSIIIPVYNTGKYLCQCVDSILVQTFLSYEIILVDDGSTDNSSYICDKYSSKNSNVHTIHIENAGPSVARNIGLSIAKGNYITFTDSDDFWSRNDILEHIRDLIIQNGNPDIILCDIIKYYNDGNVFINPPKNCSTLLNGKDKIEILEYLYKAHADLKMSACQKFVANELAKEIQFVKGLFSEDIEWSMQLYPIANKICLCDMPYYCYRQSRPGSRSTNPPIESFRSTISIIDSYSKRIPNLNIPEAEKNIYMGYLAYQLAMALNLYTTLPKSEQSKAIFTLKKYQYLFKYPTNHKTKKIKILVDILGIRTTATIIRNFISMRSKLHKLF